MGLAGEVIAHVCMPMPPLCLTAQLHADAIGLQCEGPRNKSRRCCCARLQLLLQGWGLSSHHRVVVVTGVIFGWCALCVWGLRLPLHEMLQSFPLWAPSTQRPGEWMASTAGAVAITETPLDLTT